MIRALCLGCALLALSACDEKSSSTAVDAQVPDAQLADAMPREPQPPGSACACDADCQGTEAHRAICMKGICMNVASDDCSDAGSTQECPEGSRCWPSNDGLNICWPDCAAHTCAGECDSDDACAPGEDMHCDPLCGSVCGPKPCASDEPFGACEDGAQRCVNNTCTTMCSPDAPTGFCPTGTTCTDGACKFANGCPSWECFGSDCEEIIKLEGASNPGATVSRNAGYFIEHSPYRYIRRDLAMLIQYAACEVHVRYPDAGPIGIQDLSQQDGNTPGTDEGFLRHPEGTHQGDDMDLSYFQTDGDNNDDIICGDGSDDNDNDEPGMFNDGQFCTTETNIINWGPQAYWFAKLAVTPLVRVFGVDKTLPDDFMREMTTLVNEGVVTNEEAERALQLGYGAADGWQYHHHHTHMSYNRRGQ